MKSNFLQIISNAYKTITSKIVLCCYNTYRICKRNCFIDFLPTNEYYRANVVITSYILVQNTLEIFTKSSVIFYLTSR